MFEQIWNQLFFNEKLIDTIVLFHFLVPFYNKMI